MPRRDSGERSTLGAWLLAHYLEWAKHVTGGPITAALVVITAVVSMITFNATDRTAAWVLLILTAAWFVISVFIASFRIWRTQRDEISHARDQVAANTPKLLPRIERLTVDTAAGVVGSNPLVIAFVSVANEGYKSAARNWEMLIQMSDGDKGVSEIALGPWKYVEEVPDVDWSKTPPTALTANAYDQDNAIATVTSTPIERGARPSGFFLGQIREEHVTLEELRTIRLRCVDFQNTSYYTSLPEGNIHLGSITLEAKSSGRFPPHGFKEMPAEPDRGRGRI